MDYSYYELEDVDYPVRPGKPKIPTIKDGPEAFREYATKLEKWESLSAEYESKLKDIQKIRVERMQEFKEELYRMYAPPELSEKVFEVIFEQAWEDGRHSGLHSVVERVDELGDFVYDIVKIINK